MNKIIAGFIFICLAMSSAYSKEGNTSKIIAFPNPFNNKTENLTIDKNTLGTAFNGSVTMTVYDINLKEVFEKEYAASRIRWSGFDSNGLRLKPGLYFIRLVERDSDGTGTLNQNMIKVIIK